jgi:hypothetical protein
LSLLKIVHDPACRVSGGAPKVGRTRQDRECRWQPLHLELQSCVSYMKFLSRFLSDRRPAADELREKGLIPLN